jgi:hypothetical protein
VLGAVIAGVGDGRVKALLDGLGRYEGVPDVFKEFTCCSKGLKDR